MTKYLFHANFKTNNRIINRVVVTLAIINNDRLSFLRELQPNNTIINTVMVTLAIRNNDQISFSREL